MPAIKYRVTLTDACWRLVGKARFLGKGQNAGALGFGERMSRCWPRGLRTAVAND